MEIIGKQFETDSAGKPTLEGMKQLSKAMEIYSDKHYETARYLFVKDGVIIRHKTVTAQDSGKIKDVFLNNKDDTFEVSDFRNGNIFNDLRCIVFRKRSS